ncbi:MAG: hypothetical protein WC624_01280 [Candidatus Margulisiibacteriota bacterium]
MTPPKVDNNNYNPNTRGVSLGKYNPQNGYKGTLDQIDKLFDGKKIQGIRIGNYLIYRDKEDGQLKVMENGKPSPKSAQDVLIGRYSRNGENTNVNCKAARARITQLLESPDDISGETLDFEPTSSGSTRTADSELKTESEAKFKKAVGDYKNKPAPENLQTAKDAYNYYLAVSGDDDFNNRPYKELARLNALEALSGAKTPEDLAFVLKTHRGTIDSDPELADVKNQKVEESINYLKNLDPSSHDGVTPYVLADWVGTNISSNAARSMIISGQIKHAGAVNVLADHVTDAKDKEAVAKAIVDGKINDPTKVFVLARFLNQGQIKEVISKGKVTDLETLRALARMLPAEDARQGMIAGGKQMMTAKPGTYLSNVNFALADRIYQDYPQSAGNLLLEVNEGRKTYAFVIAPADGGKYKRVFGEAPKGYVESYKPTGNMPGAKTAPAVVPPPPQPAPVDRTSIENPIYEPQHDLPAARPLVTEQKTLWFNGVRVDLPDNTEVEGSGYIATYKIKSDKTITLEAFDRTSRQWGNKQVELHEGDTLSQNGDTITIERKNGQTEFYYAVPPEVRGDSSAPAKPAKPAKPAPANPTPGTKPPAVVPVAPENVASSGGTNSKLAESNAVSANITTDGGTIPQGSTYVVRQEGDGVEIGINTHGKPAPRVTFQYLADTDFKLTNGRDVHKGETLLVGLNGKALAIYNPAKNSIEALNGTASVPDGLTNASNQKVSFTLIGRSPDNPLVLTTMPKNLNALKPGTFIKVDNMMQYVAVVDGQKTLAAVVDDRPDISAINRPDGNGEKTAYYVSSEKKIYVIDINKQRVALKEVANSWSGKTVATRSFEQPKPAPAQPAAPPAKQATAPKQVSTEAPGEYRYDLDRDRLQAGNKELTDISKQSDDYQKYAVIDFHHVVGRTIQGAYRTYVSQEIRKTDGSTPLAKIKGNTAFKFKVNANGEVVITSAKIGETDTTSHFKSATSGLKFPLPRVKISFRPEIFKEQSVGYGTAVEVHDANPNAGQGNGVANIGEVQTTSGVKSK